MKNPHGSDLCHVADRLDGEVAHEVLHTPQAQLQQGGQGHWHHVGPPVNSLFASQALQTSLQSPAATAELQEECKLCLNRSAFFVRTVRNWFAASAWTGREEQDCLDEH